MGDESREFRTAQNDGRTSIEEGPTYLQSDGVDTIPSHALSLLAVEHGAYAEAQVIDHQELFTGYLSVKGKFHVVILEDGSLLDVDIALLNSEIVPKSSKKLHKFFFHDDKL